MKDFASSLKNIRKDQGYSQKELGEKLGIGQTTIANYEKGLRFPSQEILVAIAEFLVVSVDELLGLEYYHLRPANNKAYTLKQTKQLSERLFQELMSENEQGVYDLFDTKLFRQSNNSHLLVQLYEEVITPTMYKVGQTWQNGEMTVAKEHYITGIMYKVVANLSIEMTRGLMNWRSVYTELDHQKAPGVICMSLSSEPHTLGIRMISDYFMILGYKPYYIGGNVPTSSLYDMIDKVEPAVIAISATMEYHLDSVTNLIHLIKRHTGKCKVVVGGQGFEGIEKDQIGADIIANYFDDLKRELIGD